MFRKVFEWYSAFDIFIEIVRECPLKDDEWQQCAKKSGWLEQVQLLLSGAARIAGCVRAGTSVLIHCSDGWDRTAQLTCLSSILLDPHYRSAQGLQQLLTREWLQAGHKFDHRYPLGANAVFTRLDDCLSQSDIFSHRRPRESTNGLLSILGKKAPEGEGEFAPVFALFIDALNQIINAFPHTFAYTSADLWNILLQLYRPNRQCRWGNCFSERLKAGIKPTFAVKESGVAKSDSIDIESIQSLLYISVFRMSCE